MKFLVQNQEVYIVSYVIEAESEEDAVNRWVEDGEEISTDYFCDLSDYTQHSAPYVLKFVEDK